MIKLMMKVISYFIPSMVKTDTDIALEKFGCAIFCTNCRAELHLHAQYLGYTSDDCIHLYLCKCGTTSAFNFCAAPVPINSAIPDHYIKELL